MLKMLNITLHVGNAHVLKRSVPSWIRVCVCWNEDRVTGLSAVGGASKDSAVKGIEVPAPLPVSQREDGKALTECLSPVPSSSHLSVFIRSSVCPANRACVYYMPSVMANVDKIKTPPSTLTPHNSVTEAVSTCDVINEDDIRAQSQGSLFVGKGWEVGSSEGFGRVQEKGLEG